MTPLQQLKQTKAPIKLDGSATEALYDHCKDFHFVFDVVVRKRYDEDEGTKYAPKVWYVEYDTQIAKLKVTETVNYTDVEISKSELDEIAKELINRIQIQ